MTVPDNLRALQTMFEFRSKLVGTECRLFTDRLEVQTLSRTAPNGATSEIVRYGELESVAVTTWSGVSVANLVLRHKNGRLIEMRMLDAGDAERARLVIEQMITGADPAVA